MSFYEQKIKDWLQRLYHLQAANAQLKTDLANNLRLSPASRVLEQAEYFQTQFLNKDAAISLLRHELALRAAASDEMMYSDEEQRDMERNITAMEAGWAALQQAFGDSRARE
jgi:hypothetical protein